MLHFLPLFLLLYNLHGFCNKRNIRFHRVGYIPIDGGGDGVCNLPFYTGVNRNRCLVIGIAVSRKVCGVSDFGKRYVGYGAYIC